MSLIGRVDSLWRYPVKSMRGEELDEAFMGFSGVYGDRFYAFTSMACPKGFPYLTARQQGEMLRYRPRFRYPHKAAQPPNLAEAEKIGPGLTPMYPDAADLIVDVETPLGEVLPIHDAALLRMLSEGIGAKHDLALVQSARAMTDCRPISLISVQTVQQLGEELGSAIDRRRFRANVYVDFTSAGGFGEDALVGRTLRIGAKGMVMVLERDPRCKIITLDPETGAPTPAFLQHVAQAHDGKAGVYSAVLVEGMLRKGDAVELLDGERKGANAET